MAEAILVSGATEILKGLTAVIANEIMLVWGVDDEFKKLKDTLEMISAVTTDAENRQVSDQSVRLWLRRLKGAAYDADDVLDEFTYEAMRRDDIYIFLVKVKGLFTCSNRLGFRVKMAHSIKEINQRFDGIATDKVRYMLRADGSTSSHANRRRNRITQSCGSDAGVFGRESDKSFIVDLLINSTPINNYNQPETISVVPIVGMGGLGKTRLAELVYNDESVQEHFDLKMWVYVSDDLDTDKVLRDIMESIDGNKYDSVSNVDVLVCHVRAKLKDKKFLLVLDDLWSDEMEKWDKLKSWLVDGAEGSKVLVTTRKIHVARVVQGVLPPYHLKQLSADDCWSIIREKAFSPGGALENSRMVAVGEEIAKKCSGLPLAAKMLGNIMRSKKQEHEWAAIKESDVLDKPEFRDPILPTIKLSYDDLPSMSKQCFSYCSIFPKGWEIDREALIQIWMAEGFLLSSREETAMEDVGDEYFTNLLCHSLLQNEEKDEFGEIKNCKMHDLVHSLARTVVDSEECSIMKADQVVDISEVRRLHLVFDDGNGRMFPEAGNNATKLRTFIAIEVGDCGRIESVFSNINLRIIYLTGSSIQKLPASLSKLRHLRYLNLSRCRNIDALQDGFFNKLYNLQTFVLQSCTSLSRLPDDFGSMKKLRHLDVSYTGIKALPKSVTTLSNMRTLNISYCENFERLPKDIAGWVALRSLDISHTKVSTLPDSITGLKKLANLRLKSCPNLKALPKEIEKMGCLKGIDISETNIEDLPVFPSCQIVH
ncbi:putative disease resistance protein RGA3 [Papaver somniferum]|uniref:putative disease resistance protein RGA3 n=1 Tax=Papaver somniferum TaxID=3469 RepID=UPI000E6F59A2|nr:putative disease resistance protein RGA3 [Papaver somniferum]